MCVQSCIISIERIEKSKKGVIAMAKSANLYARIEPDLKEQAELILTALGIPASNAITMFYKQIILNNGLPFEVKLPKHPLDISSLSAEQLDKMLQKGYDEATEGKGVPFDEAFAKIQKELGI